MSWWETVGSFFSDVVKVGKAVLNVVAETAGAAVRHAKQFVDEVWKEASKALRSEPKSEKERLERELQEVNAKIQHLRKKYKDQSGLNSSDTRLWKNLKEQRSHFNDQLRALDQVENAEEIVEKEADYKAIEISDDTAHILQFHVGQSTFNKICPGDHCGRPMVLQWRRDLTTAGIKDFYWGCSGFYQDRACTITTPLSRHDLVLFANLNRPEFEISSQELTKVVLDKRRSMKLQAALDSIRDQHRKRHLGIAIYRCPIHGESMILRKKKANSVGLLDANFLGCPRWLPGNAGCNFVIKLKSAAQISSVLEAESGGGIMQTV